MGHDTLLAVHVPPPGAIGAGAWRHGQPGSTLVTYRLHAQDLSLIDSFRIDVSAVVGMDFAGPSITQAVLQRTDKGYAFFTPRPEGSASYLLNSQGSPVRGKRTSSTVGTARDFGSRGRQIISVAGPTPSSPRVFRWFGFTVDGRLCTESVSQ
jgi:hypothetical protein